MRRKLAGYDRAFKVIRSCRTIEQLEVARVYAWAALGIVEENVDRKTYEVARTLINRELKSKKASIQWMQGGNIERRARPGSQASL